MTNGLPGIAGPAKLLLAVFDAQDEWHGEALHEAIVRVLEAHGIAGVTVLQGLTGFGAHRAVHQRGLIGLRTTSRPSSSWSRRRPGCASCCRRSGP
jgi:Uncharacterized ACR, COG1993